MGRCVICGVELPHKCVKPFDYLCDVHLFDWYVSDAKAKMNSSQEFSAMLGTFEDVNTERVAQMESDAFREFIATYQR